MTRVRLFVYGSLRRGERHHDELGEAAFLGAITTAARYRVAVVAGYPALGPGTDSVPGELYELPARALPALDAFEGSGYRRALVQLSDGSAAEAYVLAEAEHA